MPITNGIYTELTFDDALKNIVDDAPASIVFSPGNPPELVLANMFAQGEALSDQFIGETLATMMTSRRVNSAWVAEWRSLSISSLMAESFSMYVSVVGKYASGW